MAAVSKYIVYFLGAIIKSTSKKAHLKTIVFSANTAWYLFNFRSSSIKKVLDMGYSVICIAGKDDYSKNLEELGAQFISIPIKKSGLNLIQEFKLLKSLYSILKTVDPILIFSFTVKNNLYGSIVSKLLGLKCINNISGLGSGIINQSFATFIIKTLYKVTKNIPFHTHVQNEDDMEFMKANRLINQLHASVIPGSGVDTEYFHPNSNFVKKNLSSEAFNFIFIGRLLKDKGINELYEAMNLIISRHPNTHLTILGIKDFDNPSALSKNELSELDASKNITIYYEVDDVRGYLAQSDCLVLPSYREGMPRSILEAMSMNCPVVATDVPGCSALVSDGINGYLCDSKSHIALSSAMEKIMSLSPEDRKQLGENGRAIIEKKFSVSIVIKSVVDIINECDNA